MSVFDKQVDGEHYKSLNVQPIQVCEAAAKVTNFSGATMFKHLLRYPNKDEYVTDLEKAKHYFEFSQQFHYHIDWKHVHNLLSWVQRFIEKNKVGAEQAGVLDLAVSALLRKDGSALINYIDDLIAKKKNECQAVLCKETVRPVYSGYHSVYRAGEDIKYYCVDKLSNVEQVYLVLENEDGLQIGTFSLADAKRYYPRAIAFTDRKQAEKASKLYPKDYDILDYEYDGGSQLYRAVKATEEENKALFNRDLLSTEGLMAICVSEDGSNFKPALVEHGSKDYPDAVWFRTLNKARDYCMSFKRDKKLGNTPRGNSYITVFSN